MASLDAGRGAASNENFPECRNTAETALIAPEITPPHDIKQ
jgi:hypothetical protein